MKTWPAVAPMPAVAALMDLDSQSPDSHWFRDWVDAHYARIQRAAYALCGNAADADDLAQETFLRLLRGGATFEGRSSPETWLYAILLNVHRQRCRSDQRLFRRFLGWWEGKGVHSVSSTPEGELAIREWNDSIWGEVSRLSLRHRQVVVLCYAEQLTYAEIAEVLQCPVGTVRSRLHAAIAQLRAQIPGDISIPPISDESTPCLVR